MKLVDYLTAKGESQAAFARRAALDQRTINRICNGDGCSAETALAIIRASHADPTPGGGTIGLEDLVVERELGPAA